jgi:hypothetical protein
MGVELWRVGLLPDAGEEFWVRLPDNRASVLKLAKSKRPYSTADERLDEIGLMPGSVRDALTAFLDGQRLQDSRKWLEALAGDPYRGVITFEHWRLESASVGDLEAIDVEPLLKPDGTVQTYTRMRQDGPASQPYALTGRTIRIKWKTQPRAVESIARWRAELVPSQDEYGTDVDFDVQLPESQCSARSRGVNIVLDIDLDEIPVRAVQVRVVGLASNGAEASVDGQVIEGLSEEFWLREVDPTVELEPAAGMRRETVSTLPFGRLRFALTSKAESIEESPPVWSEDQLQYMSVTLNRRHTLRIGISPALRAVEGRRLLTADADGRYAAELDTTEILEPSEMVQEIPATELAGTEVGRRLATRRKELFASLEKQELRNLIEVAEWTPELGKRVRSYAVAYRDALAEADGTLIADLLSIDSLLITLRHPHGRERALITLPTHPLRLLWYSAYAELIAGWEAHTLEVKKDREKLLELSLLSRVAPLNFPPFSVRDGEEFLFAQNLRFFWGVSIPIEAVDPARRMADIARAVGLTEDEASLSDLPPARLAAELDSYRRIHPYLDVLKLNVVNPGAGGYIASAIESSEITSTVTGDSGDDIQLPPRIEVVAYAHDPLPITVPGLADLQERLYQAPPRVGDGPLAPYFTLALRRLEDGSALPGDDVNISLMLDSLQPEMALTEEDLRESSSSFYGLLFRLIPDFMWDGATARWEHKAGFPDGTLRERHPVTATYTDALVEGMRTYLQAVGRRRAPDTDLLPAVRSTLSPELRGSIDRLHHDSDWVVALDRFLGVDYFDDASNPDLERVARRYLLDYAPEFLEGLGHRMFVTTSQRDEVETLLSRAMTDLGFGLIEESVGMVLAHLKTISGRIALRTVGDDSRAREAVSLGVVAAYLNAQSELVDSILVPVDAHPELFGVAARPAHLGTPRSRCDLIQVFPSQRRFRVRFIETKSRSATGPSDELVNRIVDQVVATEEVFRDLFFRVDPPRLDHVLQRSRLATILRFYLRRANRHGLISGPDAFATLEDAIGRLESGLPEMQVERRGYIVNLAARPEPPVRLRDTEVRMLTKSDVLQAGFVSAMPLEDADHTIVASPSSHAASIARDHVPPNPTPSSEGDADLLRPSPGPHVDTATDVTVPRNAAARYSEANTPATSQPMLSPSSASSVSEPEGAVLDGTSENDAGDEPALGEFDVELGLTVIDQEPIAWRPRVQGSPHMFVLGIPGQGKSWTITRIITELATQGLPALVFDFHGQFSDPSGPFHRAAHPTVMDASMGLPFSPFEAEASSGRGASYWITNAFAIAEIFEYVCDLGDIQRDIVYQAVRDSYVAAGFESGPPSALPTVSDLTERLAELESKRGVKNVLPRCRPLLEFQLFSGAPTSNFADLIRSGAVLDVSRVGVEAVQLAASAFVLRKIYKDMFTWGETDRLRLVLVLDEAHRLAKDITLPKLMKEGRKFGIAVVVASQGMADFHPDVLGNAGSKVVYRTNFPMSKKVAGFLRPGKGIDLASSIEQLDVGEAYVQTEGMSVCSRVRMTPLE